MNNISSTDEVCALKNTILRDDILIPFFLQNMICHSQVAHPLSISEDAFEHLQNRFSIRKPPE